MTPLRSNALTLHQISPAEAVDRLARRLGVTRAESGGLPSPELLSETIREVVFRHTVSSEGSSPIHVQTITNQVRRVLAPLWPMLARHDRNDWRAPTNVGSAEDDDAAAGTESSPIRHGLDRLASIRELQHVGSGYWLPTPVRLIHLGSHLGDDSSARALLLGGAPLCQLRADGYMSLSTYGIIRALPVSILPAAVRADDTVWQGLDDWLGSPAEPLSEWASQLLQHAARELRPSHVEVGAFEIYLPEMHRRDSQYFRWTTARGHQLSEERLYLCRTIPSGASGPRRYWLGRLTQRQGVTQTVAEYPLAGIDIRRLLYALDAAADAPTRATVSYDAAVVTLSLSSYLPGAESRLMAAISDERSHVPGRLPLIYQIARDVAEPVLDRITSLGIRWH